MARRKEPALTPAERARNQREADERQRERCAAVASAMTAQAQAWLMRRGAWVPGEGVGERLRRLDGYRRSLVQTSAPAWRPTLRQQQAAPCAGIDVEVEF